MLTAIANSPLHSTDWALLATPSLGIPWAIVLIVIAIGLAITLSPSGRTYEVKRHKDE
jgi:hypothetical protein